MKYSIICDWTASLSGRCLTLPLAFRGSAHFSTRQINNRAPTSRFTPATLTAPASETMEKQTHPKHAPRFTLDRLQYWILQTAVHQYLFRSIRSSSNHIWYGPIPADTGYSQTTSDVYRYKETYYVHSLRVLTRHAICNPHTWRCLLAKNAHQPPSGIALSYSVSF